MWNSSSASRSSRMRDVVRHGRRKSRRRGERRDIKAGPPPRRARYQDDGRELRQNLSHSSGIRAPRLRLVSQMAFPFSSELVELRATIVLGRAPRCADELLALETMERLVQRRAFDREQL